MTARTKDAARDERRARWLIGMLELDRRDPVECERLLVLLESRGKGRS